MTSHSCTCETERIECTCMYVSLGSRSIQYVLLILGENLLTKICLHHQMDKRVRKLADGIRISGDLDIQEIWTLKSTFRLGTSANAQIQV